jgi:hypothetical protein
MSKEACLRVAVIDNSDAALSLVTVLEGHREVKDVMYFKEKTNKDVLLTGKCNCVIIDPYAFDVNYAIKLIEELRKEPKIVVALFSIQMNLYDMKDIPEKWKTRLKHYFKIFKDQDIEAFTRSVDVTIEGFTADIYQSRLKEKAKSFKERFGILLREIPSAKSNNTNIVSEEYIVPVERGTDAAEDYEADEIIRLSDDLNPLLDKMKQMKLSYVAMDSAVTEDYPSHSFASLMEDYDELMEMIEQVSRYKDPTMALCVPDISRSAIENLIKDTIYQAQSSLKLNVAVNIGILIFGVILIGVAYFTGLYTKEWALSMAFGGIGLGGVIAALVSNPLKSIGKSSRQLVQLQITYLSFMNVMTIINTSNIDSLERSKRLGEETDRVMKTLKNQYE